MSALVGVLALAQAPTPRRPLDVARVLAMRYPAAHTMSYIPALSWAGAMRLSALTGDPQFAVKARTDMAPLLSGTTPTIAEPYLLTSLAGHLAFAELAAKDNDSAALELARKGADFIMPNDAAKETVRFPRQWTDDMFMASAVWSRVGAQTKDDRYGAAVGRLLTSYAEKLQRPDGLFIHAVEGPHAWGRGNGFAALGLADALALLPASWPHRANALEIYRRHMNALRKHQAEDGMWRQVVDEPTSYREFTVTAMTIAAMSRGVRLGWLERSFVPAIDRAWEALSTRIGADGSVADVCSGTAAGATKDYYLNRPAVSGGDDRGGAMALLASIDIEELRR